jgi:hypothetical protein
MEFHGEILFHARLVFDAQFLRVVGNAAIRQPRERRKFRRQFAAGMRMISLPSFTSSREKLSSAASSVTAGGSA